MGGKAAWWPTAGSEKHESRYLVQLVVLVPKPGDFWLSQGVLLPAGAPRVPLDGLAGQAFHQL